MKSWNAFRPAAQPHGRGCKVAVLIMAWIGVLMVGACRPVEDVTIPTVVVLPSPTITDTPTLTFTPSPTFTPSLTLTPTNTPTNTPTASNTPTPTPTPTFTPTLTPTNTATFTRTPRPTLTPSPEPPTPTFTLTPSPTPSPSFTPIPPTLTPSPIPSPTLPQPIIFQFNAISGTTVVSGTLIGVAWAADADAARLEVIGQAGTVVQSIPVGMSGSQMLAAPPAAGRVFSVRLVATRLGQEALRSIVFNVTCPLMWFFGDQFAAPHAPCPSPTSSINGAYQGFERGFMIHLGGAFNRIYGLQNDGARYIAVLNGWDGATLNASPAPAGLRIPEQMFNWVYYNTLAPIGTWNSALGWANTPIALGPRIIQFEGAQSPTAPFYIDTPVGAVFRFSGGDSGTWTRIR